MYEILNKVNMKCPSCDELLVMSDRQGVEIDYCPSKCQLADALTKAIGPEKFEETLDAWRLVLSSSGSVEIDDDIKRNFIDVM